MAHFFSCFSAILFLLAQVSFLIVTNGKFLEERTDVTHHDSSFDSAGRSKRAPPDGLPRELKMRIKYITGEEIDLQLVLITQYLANEYLRVVTPFGFSDEDVMKSVGQFGMYHDISKCAAVVYFKNINAVYGAIGIDHYINIPFDFDENGVFRQGVVKKPFLRKMTQSSCHIFPDNVIPPPSDIDALEDFFSPTIPETISISSESSDDSGPSIQLSRVRRNFDNNQTVESNTNGYKVGNMRNRRDHQLYRHYYFETLIFVTRDMVEYFKRFYRGRDYIAWLVRHHIIYFNSVDMIFQTLKTQHGEIRINIAKIVIEDSLDPFEFMVGKDDIQFSDIVAKLPQYLHDHQYYYEPDSFDYVFVHTGRRIMDYTVPVNGLTKYGTYLYEARQNGRFYDVVPISVVKFQSLLADYGVAIHSISRIFNLKIDKKCEGMTSMGQCYGIMQREGPKCCNCFKWSSQSYRHFESFLRTNRNRCFFLNLPRSLRPLGASPLVSADEQCQCFGYLGRSSFRDECHVTLNGNHFCRNPLPCLKLDGLHYTREFTVYPFDGTPCDERKVCWNGECV